jgi:hypothetical protein
VPCVFVDVASKHLRGARSLFGILLLWTGADASVFFLVGLGVVAKIPLSFSRVLFTFSFFKVLRAHRRPTNAVLGGGWMLTFAD